MKIAFLFAGQGAQYPGMMKDICDTYPQAARTMETADAVLQRAVREVAFNGTVEELNVTENTQPCLLAVEIAALRALQAVGVNTDMAAGFSLGEWAALCASGVITYEDALCIVSKRAAFMQQAVPVGQGGMAVILGKTEAEVESLCVKAGNVTPSNFNCPGQITVAGAMSGIDALLGIAENSGIIAKKLAVSIPSHCSMMQPAADALQELIEDIQFAKPAYPLVMNCDGQMHTNPTEIKKNVIRQLTEPVRFMQSIRTMQNAGIATFIELGPGKVLSGLVKKTTKESKELVTILRVENMETLQAAIEALHT